MASEVAKFINEGIRPLANDLAALYYSCRVMQDRLSLPDGVGHLLEALSGKEPIDDGAASDGRPIATPENAKLFVITVQQLLENFEANDKQNLKAIIALSNRYR